MSSYLISNVLPGHFQICKKILVWFITYLFAKFYENPSITFGVVDQFFIHHKVGRILLYC